MHDKPHFNINRITKNDPKQSNYRLRDEPIKMVAKEYDIWVVPEGDGWAPASGEAYKELDVLEVMAKREVRIHGGRKQRSARAYVPRESITIVQPKKAVEFDLAMELYRVECEVTDIWESGLKAIEDAKAAGEKLINPMIAQLEKDVAAHREKRKKDIEIKECEAKIKELLGLLNRPKVAAERKKESLKRLEQIFNIDRKVRPVE